MKEQICVIGGGRWGENHIRTLYEMGNLAAVVEPDEHLLQELEEKYGMLGLTSLEEALEKAYDGYVVSSSAETHYEIGKRILERGYPCLIEKPMTMNSGEAEELVRIAREHHANFMVNRGHLSRGSLRQSRHRHGQQPHCNHHRNRF